MNILLVRAGALGDVLLLRPTVARLRAAGHDVDLLAPSGPGSALVGAGSSEVRGLLAWERADVAQLLSEDGPRGGPLHDALRAYDVALAVTRSALLLTNLEACIPRVIQCDPEPHADAGHAADWYASAVAELAPRPAAVPSAQPSPGEAEAAKRLAFRLPSGFLAIHPGSGSPRKNWAPERFAALAEAVAGADRWLLIEGPADEQAVRPLQRLAGAWSPPRLTPRALGALLARAGLFVGNDSGVSHLAAAWGASVVALFGPTDPALWRPLGERVVCLRSADGSMHGITIDSALEAVSGLRPHADVSWRAP